MSLNVVGVMIVDGHGDVTFDSLVPRNTSQLCTHGYVIRKKKGPAMRPMYLLPGIF